MLLWTFGGNFLFIIKGKWKFNIAHKRVYTLKTKEHESLSTHFHVVKPDDV